MSLTCPLPIKNSDGCLRVLPRWKSVALSFQRDVKIQVQFYLPPVNIALKTYPATCGFSFSLRVEYPYQSSPNGT